MKNKMTIFIGVLITLLTLAFLFLIYKTFYIFGFWTLLWTGVVGIASTIFLEQLFSSRTQKDSLILYNPKEWPKFLSIAISGLIGYYLYSKINTQEISNFDHIFGMAYIFFNSIIPICYSIFKIIRDRNDFISIDQDRLKYKDNSETGEFLFADIAKVELSKGIKLTLKNEKEILIKTHKMNFNGTDLSNVFKDIKSKLPENDPNENPSEESTKDSAI